MEVWSGSVMVAPPGRSYTGMVWVHLDNVQRHLYNSPCHPHTASALVDVQGARYGKLEAGQASYDYLDPLAA
jgi:hypothetical protein